MPIFDRKLTPGFFIAQSLAALLTYVVAKGALEFRDLEDAMAFYGVFHREPYNQLIHFFGVPGIIWSNMIMFAHLPLPVIGSYAISIPGIPSHPVSWATLGCLFYFLFYIYIDPYGGTLFSPFIYGMYMSASNWTREDQEKQMKKTSSKQVSWLGTGRILRLAGFIHIFSWYIQIHSHAVIEGAKPAILTSVGQALTSAPLFAFYEGLWFIGMNSELKDRTTELVAEYTIKLCEEGATMRACSTLAG